MLLPKPDSMHYEDMILYINNGTIKIPQFQRRFVWSKEQIAGLLDSILKGYPIGTFILWNTSERLRAVRNIGDLDLAETEDGVKVDYVLDGQQRMTSLYVAMKGAQIKGGDDKLIDYSDIYVDLAAGEDDPIVIVDTKGKDEQKLIKFTDMVNGEIKTIIEKYGDDYAKIFEYRDSIKKYDFSTIVVKDTPLEIATEIFTRINVGGSKLSIFEIMVAKTYDENLGFDLAEKYKELIEDLRACKYDTISSSTILQAVSICIQKECKAKQILQLNKEKFIGVWDQVVDAAKRAIDYFRGFYRIPVSQLLPYDALVVPFTYYFYKHQNNPEGKQEEYLQDYFWRVVLTSRFSSSVEAKLAQDIKKIEQILNNEQPQYDEAIDISTEAIDVNGWFSTGTAYIKGLLCILAAQAPESFNNGALVNIDNSWLKQANSRNYHHFFPRAYMRNKHPEIDERKVNHIANITIVDDFLNKRKIRARGPFDYIKEYSKVNAKLNEALATHLIGDPNDVGIYSDDYELFFQKRLEKFREQLKQRVKLTVIDRE